MTTVLPDSSALAQWFLQAQQTWMQWLTPMSLPLDIQKTSSSEEGSALPWMDVLLKGIADQSLQIASLQQRFFEQHLALSQRILQLQADGGATNILPVVEGSAADRRFNSESWSAGYYDYIRQSYLLNARFLFDVVDTIELSPREREQVAFMLRQYVDAMAPSNFAVTNPEFIDMALKTQGESVTRGIVNLLTDLEKGRLSQTDESAFELGVDLACTPGFVVFKNDLFELIQYTPTTPKVFQRPLLIIPPCINKYYILDLSPQNSLVRYLVEQGQTVFIVSWRNPDQSFASLTWDDYVDQGILAAIDAVCEQAGVDALNTVGFCLGGTLLATGLALLSQRGDQRVVSATFLTTMLDFSDTGEIGLLISDVGVGLREATIGQGGVLSGRELAMTFSALRANELIWPYVVGNYLKGETPSVFDILYWNSDATNLSGPMACWYLRQAYLENNVSKPNHLTVSGEPLDFGKIEMPTYWLAAERDHIVPWRTAFGSTRVVNSSARFVLAESGHIAGVINPPEPQRRGFRVGGDTLSQSPDDWYTSAQQKKGSWWLDWVEWLSEHSGPQIKARKIKTVNQLMAAPGAYVMQRI